jgi:hypothetical protein
MKMDLDKTPPAAEIEDAAKKLAAAKELSGTKRKRRWDISEPTDENADPNKPDTGEWSKEALEASAPKKRCSRWMPRQPMFLSARLPSALDGIRRLLHLMAQLMYL